MAKGMDDVNNHRPRLAGALTRIGQVAALQSDTGRVTLTGV